MEERLYRCEDCGHVFRLPATGSPAGGASCPECGGGRLKALTAWAPEGSGLDRDAGLWEYQCQDCRHTFKKPVPASPTEERQIVCPACQGHHIHRIAPFVEPLYCG